MTTSRRNPVRRQLEAYKEEWLADHEDAMRCRNLESLLHVGVWLFNMIRDVDEDWRIAVSGGRDEYRQEDDEDMRNLYEVYLEASRRVEKVAAEYERRFSTMRHAEDFRKALVQAEGVLASWQPPAQQQAPGVAPLVLDDDEAERLRNWGKDGKGRLVIQPRKL